MADRTPHTPKPSSSPHVPNLRNRHDMGPTTPATGAKGSKTQCDGPASDSSTPNSPNKRNNNEINRCADTTTKLEASNNNSDKPKLPTDASITSQKKMSAQETMPSSKTAEVERPVMPHMSHTPPDSVSEPENTSPKKKAADNSHSSALRTCGETHRVVLTQDNIKELAELSALLEALVRRLELSKHTIKQDKMQDSSARPADAPDPQCEKSNTSASATVRSSKTAHGASSQTRAATCAEKEPSNPANDTKHE